MMNVPFVEALSLIAALSLKGTKSIAGGNAPGRPVYISTLNGSHRVERQTDATANPILV